MSKGTAVLGTLGRNVHRARTGPQQEVAGGACACVAAAASGGALWAEASLRHYAVAAGFGSGEHGAPLASLTAAATAAAAGVLRAGRRGGCGLEGATRMATRDAAGARSREIAGSL